MGYRRIEKRRGYDIITEVDEVNYKQTVKYNDGAIGAVYKTTLEEMGWRSLKEFLNSRSGFYAIN